MEKKNIKADPQICTGCQCCQLICSFTYLNAFNPERARIVIDPPDIISFTDECIKNCHLCANYCPVGAITRQ